MISELVVVACVRKEGERLLFLAYRLLQPLHPAVLLVLVRLFAETSNALDRLIGGNYLGVFYRFPSDTSSWAKTSFKPRLMENQNIPLPQSKIVELKSLIDSHLRSQNIYGQIRDFVRQATKADDPSADDDSNKGVVLDALREKGVIEEVIKSIKRPRNLATPSSLIASTKQGHTFKANWPT